MSHLIISSLLCLIVIRLFFFHLSLLLISLFSIQFLFSIFNFSRKKILNLLLHIFSFKNILRRILDHAFNQTFSMCHKIFTFFLITISFFKTFFYQLIIHFQNIKLLSKLRIFIYEIFYFLLVNNVFFILHDSVHKKTTASNDITFN